MEKSTKEILKEIQDYFDKIESLYWEIPDEIQNEILKAHWEDHSLPYCIRWWKQAVDELLEDWI